MPRVQQPTSGPAPAVPATMAITGIGGIPPGVPPPLIPSSDPDKMVSAGMADNFNGRVVGMALLPRKLEKGKKANSYELFAEIDIKADDVSLGREGIVTEFLKMDQLNQFVPSRTDPVWDGSRWVYTPAGSNAGRPATVTDYMALHLGQSGFPVPGDATGKQTAVLPPDDWKGWFAIPGAQNSRVDFMKGTKWDHFTTKLREVGYKAKAPHINWGDFRQMLIGVYGLWVRIPFEFKGAPPKDNDDQQQLSTLCLAQIFDLGPISGANGPVSTTAQVVVPAAVPVAQPITPVPAPMSAVVPAPAAVTPAPAPASVGLTPANDPKTVSDATNAILTQLAAAKGAAGVLKAEAGTAVYEGINKQGLDAGLALRFLNDAEWIVDDERTFGYIPERGLIVPLG